MNVLAVIPARGGSKGVPRKNMRKVAGRPLVAWSIDAAAESKWIFQNPGEGRAVVSTDDPKIGAFVRFQDGRAVVVDRPAELATDTAPTDLVLAHALEAAERDRQRADLVVLLQPTVPVRRPGLVDACVERLLSTGADSLLTAYPLHFVWWRERDIPAANVAGPYPTDWRSQCPRRPRRQDMEHRELMWHEDGAVYVCRAELLRGDKPSRLGGRIEVFETTRTVDIDTEADLVVADAMLRRGLAADRRESA